METSVVTDFFHFQCAFFIHLFILQQIRETREFYFFFLNMCVYCMKIKCDVFAVLYLNKQR